MEQWNIEFFRGKTLLSHHQTSNAIRVLSAALKLCPPCECGGSSKILFYIGIALKRLGYYSGAIKLWISANRIKKNRLIKKMIERYANGYGMLKQATDEIDDCNAFFSIQIHRYLEKKQNRKFSTQAEQDVVFELCNDYWKSLIKNDILNGKGIAEKRGLFHRIKIAFPYFYMPKCMGDTVLNVNFNNVENNDAHSRCFCGSGLSFTMCCGRTPTVEELVNGVF